MIDAFLTSSDGIPASSSGEEEVNMCLIGRGTKNASTPAKASTTSVNSCR